MTHATALAALAAGVLLLALAVGSFLHAALVAALGGVS